MPLHVDRASVHAGMVQREHVLAPRSFAQAGAAPDAADPDAEGAAVIRLAAVISPDRSDVESIDHAEAIVQALLARGGGALGAHGSLDSSRVHALLAG